MLRFPSRSALITYLKISFFLTIAFVALYGYGNWSAMQQPSTYQLWLSWELGIPFVPAMIIFYFSLNLLMLLPLFTLNEKQMLALGKAMGLSTIIAFLFFVFLPARIGFVRTTDAGIWSEFYRNLYSVDHDANTFPSLHITYSFLMIRFITNAHKKWIPFLYAWFLMISLSVVLTHQHHLVDIAGGILLAEMGFRFFSGRGIQEELSGP